MTKEWQEATNEYLKVRTQCCQALIMEALGTVADDDACTEREIEPHLRYQQRGLQWEGLCAEQAGEETMNIKYCRTTLSGLIGEGKTLYWLDPL
jgi:hypothetical protein